MGAGSGMGMQWQDRKWEEQENEWNMQLWGVGNRQNLEIFAETWDGKGFQDLMENDLSQSTSYNRHRWSYLEITIGLIWGTRLEGLGERLKKLKEMATLYDEQQYQLTWTIQNSQSPIYQPRINIGWWMIPRHLCKKKYCNVWPQWEGIYVILQRLEASGKGDAERDEVKVDGCLRVCRGASSKMQRRMMGWSMWEGGSKGQHLEYK